MGDLVFRNAEEEDVEPIVDLILNHSLSERSTIGYLLGKDRERVLTHLVRAGGNLYGYEQATLATRDGEVVGLFMGYPLAELRVAGPNTLSLTLRQSPKLSWLGLVRRHARLNRIEASPPADCYMLALIRARGGDEAVLDGLLKEAEAEAAEEECPVVAFNSPSSVPVLPALLARRGFEESARRGLSDRKLSAALGFDEVVQYVKRTSYVPPPEPEAAAEETSVQPDEA